MICSCPHAVSESALTYVQTEFRALNRFIRLFSCLLKVTRGHSYSSNPRRNAVVSQICINIGVILISMKNALIDHVTLTFDLSTQKPCHSKVIPCNKFEHFGIIRFWVMLRTNKQTNRRIRTYYPRRTTLSAWVITISYTLLQMYQRPDGWFRSRPIQQNAESSV